MYECYNISEVAERRLSWDQGDARMTYEEMRAKAQDFHSRGDAIGMYRFLRDRVAHAASAREEGIARVLLADTLILWRLGTPTEVEFQLGRAKALLRGHPADRANAVFVHLAWRAGEGDASEVHRLLGIYERLCAQYPESAGVQRWRGRISTWLGRLAQAQGDLPGAIRHFERSLVEYRQYELDPESRAQLERISKLRLAQFALHVGDGPTARRYLDECEGATISRLWETVRACSEVEYALSTHNLERVQFWMRLARSWATPQSESATVLTLIHAKVSYASGDLEKARLLTLEARRLAARYKQDHILTEIREFFRVQASGVGAGQFAQGGIPREKASESVAAGDAFRPADRRGSC